MFPEAACCGDWCGKCPNYQTTCRGCLMEDHPECPFISCLKRRNPAHCGLCEEFPCEELVRFVPDDRCKQGYHVESLKVRTQLGTEKWLLWAREKWEDLA